MHYQLPSLFDLLLVDLRYECVVAGGGPGVCFRVVEGADVCFLSFPFLFLLPALVSTSCTHSGYILLGAQNHDWHHEHFNYNYGTDIFMDRVFGTKFIGSKRWTAVMKRKKKAMMSMKESDKEDAPSGGVVVVAGTKLD